MLHPPATARGNPSLPEFDFIDVSQFHTTACGTRLTYGWLWLMFIKSIAVYIADIYTLVALLASNRWSASILQSDAAKSDSDSSNVLQVPFSIGKWIFFGCIIFSFLLLLWEGRKARAIIKSRDISYAFTNVMSQNWYALRSYDHYCFFCQIDNSKKKKDEFAFFVFFTFKGWKRLLLADAPRQVINALTLYAFGKSENWTTDFSVYWSGSLVKKGILVSMLFTVIVWVISALLLLVAAVMYIPLLCYIQGNLKEYCCHKVDKRIAELMKRKNRRRLAQEAKRAAAEARGDFSHLKDKKTGKMLRAPMAQPTLPKIGLDDDDLYSDTGSIRGGGEKHAYPPSTIPYGNVLPYSSSGLARQAYPYASSDSDSLAGGGNPKAGFGGYAESVTSLDGFASRAAPMAGAYGDSTATLALPGGAMTRAPSYRTNPSTGHEGGAGGAGYEYDEKYVQMATATTSTLGASQFGALAFEGDGMPSGQQHSLSHSASFRSDYGAGGGGNRQQLYERAQQQNEADAVPYFQSSHGRGTSVAGGDGAGVAYGGWEESGPGVAYGGEFEERLEQQGGGGGGDPYYHRQHSQQPSDGNFAGRGAWGAYR
ncbi:Potassium transporter [Rhodosporidiobolus nylandii]